LTVAIVPPIEGKESTNRNLAIWMGADGVYVSDGRHPIKVSLDINDLWNQTATTHINQSYISSCAGFIDNTKLEYHLLVATTTGTVTTLDTEYVLDLQRWKWFNIDRGTGKKLQCACTVIDSSGNNYTYGFIDTGYMERLENGTTFDGNNIVSTIQTGDFPLIENNLFTETTVKALVPIIKAKTLTSNDITLTHYRDAYMTGADYTIDPTKASYRLSFPVKVANSAPALFHSVKMALTTSNENSGLEPIALGIYYLPVREYDYE
jgi:hypothetical protein